MGATDNKDRELTSFYCNEFKLMSKIGNYVSYHTERNRIMLTSNVNYKLPKAHL
jgi:hypothetical protein